MASRLPSTVSFLHFRKEQNVVALTVGLPQRKLLLPLPVRGRRVGTEIGRAGHDTATTTGMRIGSRIRYRMNCSEVGRNEWVNENTPTSEVHVVTYL